MTYNIVYRPSVNWDITDATEYYNNISAKLAKQFIFRIREAAAHINRNPLGFQIKYKNVRTVLLKQFPYHIHYTVDESRKQVVILAVINAYRNPADYSAR